MDTGPFYHHRKDAGRERARQHPGSVDRNRCLTPAVPRVEVWWRVIVEEHGDRDPEKRTDPWHAARMPRIVSCNVIVGVRPGAFRRIPRRREALARHPWPPDPATARSFRGAVGRWEKNPWRRLGSIQPVRRTNPRAEALAFEASSAEWRGGNRIGRSRRGTSVGPGELGAARRSDRFE